MNKPIESMSGEFRNRAAAIESSDSDTAWLLRVGADALDTALGTSTDTAQLEKAYADFMGGPCRFVSRFDCFKAGYDAASAPINTRNPDNSEGAG